MFGVRDSTGTQLFFAASGFLLSPVAGALEVGKGIVYACLREST